MEIDFSEFRNDVESVIQASVSFKCKYFDVINLIDEIHHLVCCKDWEQFDDRVQELSEQTPILLTLAKERERKKEILEQYVTKIEKEHENTQN